jgi:hypothetical protein
MDGEFAAAQRSRARLRVEKLQVRGFEALAGAGELA